MRHIALATLTALSLIAASPLLAQTPAPATGSSTKMAPAASDKMAPAAKMAPTPAAAALQHMHNAADDAAIVLPLDPAHVRWQVRFNPLPLRVAQPK